MKKAKKLIVGNWKMNPISLEEAKNIAGAVKRSITKVRKTEVVICPPFVYISPLSKLVKGNFRLGAQNANSETAGPYTGEVSHTELPQFEVSYVILGHSERRKMGETDEVINKKVKSVVNSGMTAILCIGESVRDGAGDYLDNIRRQLMLGMKDVSKRLMENVVIAYEPIWAIGAKDAMAPRDLHEMTIYIKKVLRDMFSFSADGVRVIYGGAVDHVNAEALIKEGNVSGFLIGRESLRSKDFIEIIKLVDAV